MRGKKIKEHSEKNFFNGCRNLKNQFDNHERCLTQHIYPGTKNNDVCTEKE